MIRKRNLIKKIQKRMGLKSFREAKEVYEIVTDEMVNGLNEEGAIKIEGIGIIKKVIKPGREIKVPTKEEKITVEDREGLSFKEDSSYKPKR